MNVPFSTLASKARAYIYLSRSQITLFWKMGRTVTKDENHCELMTEGLMLLKQQKNGARVHEATCKIT